MGRYTLLKINSSNAVKNNSGAIINVGGTVASNSPITKVVTSVRPNQTYGSDLNKFANSANGGLTAHIHVKKIVSAAPLPYQAAQKYVVIGLATTLAGQSNTLLLNSAAYMGKGRQSIHKNESNYTLKAITAGWNYSTGAFLSTPTVENTSFGNDEAARPTSAIPGELVYHNGTRGVTGNVTKPIFADYSASTSR